jgi:hypothetical protein
MSAVGGSQEARVNGHPFGRSFAAAGVVVVLVLGVLVVTLGPPDSAEGFGRVVGSLSLSALLAAPLIGWIARRSSKPWRWWRYFGALTPVMVLLAVLSGLGRAGQ